MLIHGGAGTIPREDGAVGKAYLDALRQIIAETFNFCLGIEFNKVTRVNLSVYDTLGTNKNAVDVVEFAVTLLENEPLFNAGRGAVFAENGG